MVGAHPAGADDGDTEGESCTDMAFLPLVDRYGPRAGRAPGLGLPSGALLHACAEYRFPLATITG